MKDILDKLATSTCELLRSGYYEAINNIEKTVNNRSFIQELSHKNSLKIVAEIKQGAPSRGKLSEDGFDPFKQGELYLEGGAAGLSVITAPKHFFGSLDNLNKVTVLGLPVLMKDFVIDPSQIEAAKTLGADAVLFIHRLFSRNYTSFSLEEGIKLAHCLGLEVLLEVNDGLEYKNALKTGADMIGINNRDLRTLEVDLSLTKRILKEYGKDRTVWTMSGISSRKDINCLKTAGVDAFLVGTSLMQAEEPIKLLRKLRGMKNG